MPQVTDATTAGTSHKPHSYDERLQCKSMNGVIHDNQYAGRDDSYVPWEWVQSSNNSAYNITTKTNSRVVGRQAGQSSADDRSVQMTGIPYTNSLNSPLVSVAM